MDNDPRKEMVMKALRALLLLIVIFLAASPALGATITSAISGNWNDVGTWVGATVPSSTDSVVISSGHTVRFDRNDASTTCGPININSSGTLIFESTPTIPKTMQVKGDINVYGTLELNPGSTLKMECETNGQYGIIIQAGGTLRGTGSVPTILTTLSAPLAIGGQTITVASASGFGVGDIITLGSGASAEGFTVSSIAGNTITLNRKALNAQEIGAEVYKNATVTTSSISPGQRTFTVADVGGIMVGDILIITANPTDYYSYTENVIVESIASPNIITLASNVQYQHDCNSIVAKVNRNISITSKTQDNYHNGYILIKPSGILDVKYITASYLGKDYNDVDGWDKAGIAIKSSVNTAPIVRSSILNNYCGIFNWAEKLSIVSNVLLNNRIGIGLGSKSSIISNIFSKNFWPLHNSIWNVLIKDNYFVGNSYWANAGTKSITINNAFLGSGLEVNGGEENIIAGNIFKVSHYSAFFSAVFICNKNNLFANNHYEGGTGVETNYSSTGGKPNIFCDSYFKNGIDFAIGYWWWGNEAKLILRNNRSESSNLISGAPYQNASYILVQNYNGLKGATKIYGDFIASSNEYNYNYSTQTYSSSATVPLLFRGSDHTISAIETNDGTTTTEVWFVTYRSATSNWEIKGTVSGLQTNRATSGVAYTSDAGQVRLTITQAAGVQEGDQFVFATIAAAGDANTQKKILFGPSAIPEFNNQSRLTVDPGGKVELKGSADYPTLIDYDGDGAYGFVISGEVDAQYFDFNQINAGGVKIDPTATITRFDNGAIRNVKGAGPHLSINGKDHTFNYINYDNTGTYDVKAQNDADLVFIRSQRGTFADQVLDTSSVSWDDPVLGYTQPKVIGTLLYDSGTRILTIPFKIKDPNSTTCTYKANSFQYSTNGGLTWDSVLDTDLSGIGASFASSTDYGSAPEHTIYWNTGTNYANLEANLAVRFRVNNGFIYGDYGSSEAIPFNLVPPVVQVLSPNGGEIYRGGGSATITWSAADEGSGIADNSIALYYNISSGDVLIADNLPNTGSYTWTAPAITTSEARVKITARDNVGQTGQDISDAVFSIDSTPPNPPTINISTIKTPTLINYQTIGGSRTTDSANIVANGSSDRVSLPTSTTWTVQVTLVKGRNNVAIKAVDSVGNESSPEVVIIEGADRTFTDSVSGASVAIPFGAPTVEVESVNFDRIDLLIPPPRGANSTGKAFKIISIVDAFSLPVGITLPKPSGISNLRCYTWNSANRWNRNSIKEEDDNSFAFDSNILGTYTIFEIVDFNPPNIGDIKIDGRLVSAGDSIKNLPVLTVNISDDYGMDLSSNLFSVDGGVDKSLNANQAQSVGASVTGSYAFSEAEKLSLGYHTFKIMAADEVGNTASCEATLFVIGDSIPGLIIYPNPFKLGAAGGIKFDGLTEDIRVRIYDIAGDLVWSGQNAPGSASLTWTAVNSSGAQVVPGVYLYVVTANSGGKASGKIAVIR
ncbi:hypothetical protein HZC35_03360 [Candidatus Saganbacteria bacterium]|nr:hypothetical protein [Candidatus Saganbacteria bacterium]